MLQVKQKKYGLFKIIAWVYEADYHCQKCSKKRFRELEKDQVDKEGNEIKPVYDFEFDFSSNNACGTCKEVF